MSVQTALKLGRVSNLPTVWTNVIAGVALSTLEIRWLVVVPVALAASLLYVAGMYLNDAFDRRWDAEHRPERPIPSGEVPARLVFQAGFGMMAAALVVLAVAAGERALFLGAVLAGLIVLYDVFHKRTPFAPAIMGLCRVAVYLLAATAAGRTFAPPVVAGAVFLFCYLVLLSTIARRETTDPKLPRLVGRLIAGISLVDGAQLLVVGPRWGALVCVAAFALTLRWQRRVAGT